MACCAIVEQSSGQTLNFVNQVADRVWNTDTNWNPQQLPTTSTYAAVDWSIAPELYITDGNGTISAIASVGTLAITGGSSQYVLRATGSGFIPGHTAAPASITFGAGGSVPIASGLDYIGGTRDLIIGCTASIEGALTAVVPNHLTMRARGEAYVDVWCKVTGAGSISLSVLPGQTSALFVFGRDISPLSDSTGGTTIGPGVTQQVLTSSIQSAGSIMLSGPIGVGTCNLNGGTLMFFNFEELTLANPINVTADSRVFLKDPITTLLGDVRTNGNRISILASLAAPLTFRDCGWSAGDSGTIALSTDASVTLAVDSGASA